MAGGGKPHFLEGGSGKAPSSYRVVMLLEDLEFGGTQRQTLELAQNLDRSRFAPELWLMKAGYDLLPLAEKGGIRVVPLSRSSCVGPSSVIGLWRQLKSRHVDLLLLLTVTPNIWGRLLGRLARVPVIVATCRGGGSPLRQHERWLWPLADHLVCNTFALKNHLVGHSRLPEDHITVIPNGVNTSFFCPPSGGSCPRKKIILCIARLVPDKDHETLLTAFGLFARMHLDVELWLVGNGKLQGPLKRQAAYSIPKGRVRFLPGQLDLRSLFHQASIFVLSSRQEALPNVVLEAMASGLPVVATAVGGLPEVVEHGRTGLLAPKQNAPALAQAMEQLLMDENTRAALGKAGRKRAVAGYSIATMVRNHEEVFLRLLNSRR